MKLIIAGSRTFQNMSATFIDDILKNFQIFNYVLEVVSGGARGIDSLGEEWAKNVPYNKGMMISSSFVGRTEPVKIKIFEADWEEHGKAAGPIRNREMAKYSDALLLIWDGESKGSANMRQEMQKLNKPIYEVVIRKLDNSTKL